MGHPDILFQIASAIVIATCFALVARLTRQPLILAYIAAGIVVGPTEGLGWLNIETIEPISELGLILLLFMIGLEIDLKKIKQSGAALIAVGLGQFLICVLLGIPFMRLLGYQIGGGDFSGLYLAVGAALSSTMIVVKLLYDKFELDTLPGRMTLGILVFQDIWAILFLALQHDLKNPAPSILLISLVKGIAVVIVALLASRFVLPGLFRSIAKRPELVVLAALAWCFVIALLAAEVGLSREMGALIAGISLSTGPYNLDVIAKIISLRDFFIVLFFVTLGAKIPRPTAHLAMLALAVSAFVVASRFISITPVLHAFKAGTRISFIPALNLSQISEFSLVICALGVTLGHVPQEVMSVLVFTLLITSVLSTYAIEYNHQLYLWLKPALKKIGLKDWEDKEMNDDHEHESKPIVFLGFSRFASSLFQELLDRDPELIEQIGVVDFNPQVKMELDRRGVQSVYGDIAHADTLDHAKIHDAKVLICTIPDAILKGTTNSKLLRQLQSLAPEANAIVTSEIYSEARELYQEGAAYVFIPRLGSIKELATVVVKSLNGNFKFSREEAAEQIDLREQQEVIP
jgi:Kef-type K+ transport system membrane component KefB